MLRLLFSDVYSTQKSLQTSIFYKINFMRLLNYARSNFYYFTENFTLL